MAEARDIECELCLVGTGIAGLNALSSAKPYLERGDVVLVDRREAAGGMWHDTYDYVRLHQPHPFFTVGTTPWNIGKPRSYLARKPEILAHLQRCAREVLDGLSVTELYEHEYVAHEEVEANGRAAVVQVRDANGAITRVRARTLIKAFGYNVWPKAPLSLSSEAVRSVTPHDPELLEDDAPVVLLGSGKTAMDTATTLLRRDPSRLVDMIGGRGTIFMNRAIGFPTGLRSLFGGTTGFRLATDICTRFDGSNAPACMSHLRETYGLSLHPEARHYAFGILSPEELDFVREGLREHHLGHAEDVRDGDAGPELVLRDGSTHPLAEGTFVVNCTGYLDPDVDYEPFRSAGGAVLSIGARSALHFLSTHTGWLLPHLHYRGLLETTPLYELDAALLRRRDKEVWPCAVYAHALYNMLLVLDVLPPKVFETMGVNFDGWFPLPRRLWDLIEVRRRGARYRGHARDVLDRVNERFRDVACGPL